MRNYFVYLHNVIITTLKKLLVIFLVSAGLGLQGQATQLTNASGLWKGYFHQKNFDPTIEADTLQYRTDIRIFDTPNGLTGFCTIYWNGEEEYYATMDFEGSYNNTILAFTEIGIADENPKPGYGWCTKQVKARIALNPTTGEWLMQGRFTGQMGESECMPGTFTLTKYDTF